ADFPVYRPVPSFPVGVAVIVTGVGMYLLTGPGGTSGGINIGDLLTLACAVLFAFQIVAAGHFAPTARPDRLLALELTATGLLSAIAAPFLQAPRPPLDPRTPGAVLVLTL